MEPLLTDRFIKALNFATELHQRQIRKGSGIPYVSHLLAVTSLVLEDGGGEDDAIAAMLHDAIEDQGGAATREKIRERFGSNVVRLVDGCTDAEVTPKPPWRERKQRYIEHLAHASPDVRRISAADKLHNARSIVADLRRVGRDVFTRFNAGQEGTLWYYRELVKMFKTHADARHPGSIAEELERVVDEMERLAGK